MSDVSDLRQARYRAENQLAEYIEACNDVAREVYDLHTRLNYSLGKLAKELDVSRGRVQQLVRKGKVLVNEGR